MHGGAVADLQEALQLLLASGSIGGGDTKRANALRAEHSRKTFGRATELLVASFQEVGT